MLINVLFLRIIVSEAYLLRGGIIVTQLVHQFDCKECTKIQMQASCTDVQNVEGNQWLYYK